MSATTTEDGVDMDIAVGFAQNGTYMSLGVSYEDNDPTRIDMYNIDDKVYVYAEMLGESQWTYALAENEDEVEDLMGVSEGMVDGLDTDVFDNAKYEKEVEENGVVYDILLLEEETSTSRFYIDRETQEIEKLVIEQDGETVEYEIKDIDEIELPKDAENAQEVTMEDVGMTFMAVIFAAMGDVEGEVEFTPETNVDTNVDTNIDTNVNVDANLNNPSFDENVTINGKTYTLGVSKPVDIENGFGETFYDRDDLDLVLNPDYYESLWFYLGDDEKYTVWAYFANFTDEPQKLSDCTLYQITIEADGYTSGEAFEDDLSFVVGNAVTDETKASELLAAFGEPSYTYHSDDYNLDDYEFDLPLGADYFDCLYELEVGYNAGGMYSFSYELR